MSILEIKNLNASYARSQILFDLNIDIQEG